MTTAQPAAPRSEAWQNRRSDALVGAVVLLALVIGWVYRGSLLNQTKRLTDDVSGLQLDVPATWISALDKTTAIDLAVVNPRAASAYKTQLALYSRVLDPDNPAPLDGVIDRLIERHTADLDSYQLLAVDNRTVQGADSAVLEYAHVVNPIDDPFRASVPVVVHVVEYVIYTPTQYWVLTLSADEQAYAATAATFEKIVQSVQLP